VTVAFPASFLEELRSRASLAAVIGRHVRLIRKGREQIGLCPFHNEKTPSFTVNEDKGFYHCFGCGAHGDVISFVMQSHSLSFPEAVERLAAEAGLEVPVQSPDEREKARHEASLYDALESACALYEKTLRGGAGRAALDYLIKRGLDSTTIARFRLGFSPDSKMAVKQALKTAGVAEELAVAAGLLIAPDGGGDTYDRFRGRVMFPIADRRGRVIAFGGRAMGDAQPKYLNSPETPLFHKGATLYGLAQAREPAAKVGSIVVCEGYMDVIALNRAGFPYAVAPLGTALTEQQIALLWTVAAEPIICLDGDTAGQRAAVKAAERALPLLKPGFSLRFAAVPSPEDPDSLVRKHGAAAMRDVLARAEPLSDVLWRRALATHPSDTPERRAALERDLMDIVERITDRLVRDQYRSNYRNRLWEIFRAPPASRARPAGVAPRDRQRLGRRHSIDRGPDGTLPGTARPSPPPAQRPERVLLSLVIRHPQILEAVAERLGLLQFADSALDNVRQEVLKHLDCWGSLDSEGAQRYLRSSGFSQILDHLLDTGAHEQSACNRSDASDQTARDLWEQYYKLYTGRELAAELQQAEQQAAVNLSDETFSYLSALWLSKTEGEKE
jgi:DNA primase